VPLPFRPVKLLSRRRGQRGQLPDTPSDNNPMFRWLPGSKNDRILDALGSRKSIGPYEIAAPVGAGGMGEVY